MDVHALGSSRDDQSGGYSDSYEPLLLSRGQWLPYRGRDVVILAFPPPLAPLSEGRGFNPRDWQKIEELFHNKFCLQETHNPLMLTFL